MIFASPWLFDEVDRRLVSTNHNELGLLLIFRRQGSVAASFEYEFRVCCIAG